MAMRSDTLEEQITQWRAWLRRRPAIRGSDVEELEAHLRDQVAALADAGLAADEAFLVAVKRMGNLDAVSREFAREHSERLWKQLVVAPGGVGETARRASRETLVVAGLAARRGARAQAARAVRPAAPGQPRRGVPAVLLLQPQPLRAAVPGLLLRLEAPAAPGRLPVAGAGVRRRPPRRQRLSVHARRPHAGAGGAAPAERPVAGGGRRLRRRALARRGRTHGLRALLGRAVHLLRSDGPGRRRAHRFHLHHLRGHRRRRRVVRAALAAPVRGHGGGHRRRRGSWRPSRASSRTWPRC